MTTAAGATSNATPDDDTTGERSGGLPGDLVPLIIGVTGHRDLVDDEIPQLRQRVRDFFAMLRKQHPDLPIVVMSPLAEGADRLVAEEAHKLGIPLFVPLPFAAEIYEQDFQSAESVAEFRALCAGAEVTELIQGYVVGRQLETTEEDLMEAVFPHPTLSEMMHESVLDAYDRVIHI